VIWPGQVLRRETKIRAGLRVLSTGERTTSTTVEDRERFAAFVAHELRAPIALQRALVEVTLADPHADAAALREMGERVVTSCVRQKRVIDALLDLARSGRELTRHEPVDIAATAAAAIRAHEMRELESVVVLEPAQTTGEPDLLELLVANLVSNAIRHNIVGGRVEIATRAEAGRAVLSVANTGPLVPAAELQCLFEPFHRRAPQPPDAEGVGLGLAIVQAIADAHNALVTATPRSGGGLKVDVRFP
jgi:signal transduction histidine kinase